MKDDLQKLIDSQLQSGKGDSKKSFSKTEIDNIILTPDETKIPEGNTIPKTPPVAESDDEPVEKEIPTHVVDLDEDLGAITSAKIKPKIIQTPHRPEVKQDRPKTIADLLSIEANVAKNPPTTKTRPDSSSPYSYENSKENVAPEGIDKIKENLKQISYSPKTDSSIIKKLRTLEGDIQEAMRSGKTTLTSFVASEMSQKSMITPPKGALNNTDEKIPGKSSSSIIKIVAVFVGLILLGGGGYALYYILVKEKEPIMTIDLPNGDQPFIPTQFETKISTDKRNSSYIRAAIAAERKQNQNNLNEVGNVLLTKKGLLREENLNTQEFVRALELRMPSELLRTLYSSYMLGLHRFTENQSFIILKTDSYDTARASMLDWEKNLEEDIGKVLRSSGDFEYATSSDSVTNRRVFKDETIKNQDARVLYDENNNFLFLYTFLKDRETIVFTSHPETLAEILSGLSARKVVD